MHGTGYVNCRLLGKEEHAKALEYYTLQLLEKTLQQANITLLKPIYLIGPETLGATMAEVAAKTYNLMHNQNIKYAKLKAHQHPDGSKTFSWAEENPPIAELGAPDTQAVFMDDLLNASSTLKRTRPIIEEHCPILAASFFADRSGLSSNDIDVPHCISLAEYDMQRYPQESCPCCEGNVPMITNFGHGEKFQARNPNYPGGFYEM